MSCNLTFRFEWYPHKQSYLVIFNFYVGEPFERFRVSIANNIMQITWAPTHEETKLIRAVLELADRINGLNVNVKTQLMPLLTQVAYMEKTTNQSPYFPLTIKSIGYLNQVIEHAKHGLLQLMTQEVDELFEKEEFREMTSYIAHCVLHGDGKVPEVLYRKGWRAENTSTEHVPSVYIWKEEVST